MLRARDAIDRAYAQPLDTPALASVAFVSEAHFIRTFRSTFGETPHRYLQRRRVERHGMSPTVYRERTDIMVAPTCFTMAWTRPSSFGEASRKNGQ